MGTRQDLVISDCSKCKQMTTQAQRQSLGCGHEPTDDRLPVMCWSPPGGECGYRGPRATVCPGYSTNLPEVVEVVIQRLHWDKGQLASACGSEPTEETLQMIVILEAAFNDVKRWSMTPSDKCGGAQ